MIHAAGSSQRQRDTGGVRRLVTSLAPLLFACTASAPPSDRNDATRVPAQRTGDMPQSATLVDPPAALEGDCVPIDPTNDRSGAGPSIATWVDLELDTLAAAIPEQVADAKAGQSGIWKRGMAGHGQPNVINQFQGPGDASHFLRIADLQHQCRCSAGMGARLRDALVAGAPSDGKAEAVEIHGHPGAVLRSGTATGVHVWVSDRCEVSISSGDTTRARSIIEAVDFTTLATLCAARKDLD